eukprot:scaffold41_cov90-Isochrysis_galbana.AAC.2
MAVTKPASCDLAPTELLTAEREKEPVIGYEEKTEPSKLEMPSAKSSCVPARRLGGRGCGGRDEMGVGGIFVCPTSRVCKGVGWGE